MILGQKGVKYGLEVRKPKETDKASNKKNRSVFGEEDDSEDEYDDVERQIARHAARKKTDKKVIEMQAQALAEDASVFDYDSHFDAIQEARVAPKREDKLNRQSRYIGSLLEKAEERKKEQDVLYERRLAKERAAEDHLFGDKEKFVTAAYKKKLEEDAKWHAERKKKEKEEEINAVEKRGHMGDFYRNLLQGNVAFGAKVGAEVSVSPAAAQKPVEESPVVGREAGESDQRIQDDDIMPERRAQHQASDVSGVRSLVHHDSLPTGHSSISPDANVEHREGQEHHLNGAEAGVVEREDGIAIDRTATAGAVCEQRQNKRDVIAAARERYLARKRKASGMD